MYPVTFPGGLSELEFVNVYARSALRKPQLAADAALRALVFAESGERAILTGLIGCELAESCRRLVAVYNALSDRRYSIARTLLRPLPGVEEWQEFIHWAAILSPEQTLRELSLPDDALPHATLLRSQPDLPGLTSLVAAACTGNAMLLVPGLDRRQVPTESWVTGVGDEGECISSSFGAGEMDAIALADLTGDFSSIARGFLMSYLGARYNAGRRD
jgi:hypothetical protein